MIFFLRLEVIFESFPLTHFFNDALNMDNNWIW